MIAAGHGQGPDPLAVATRGLDDEEPAVRAAALGALGRLGALDPGVLLAGLADPVQVRHLGGHRFVVWMSYRLGFVSPKPEKGTK